MAGEGVGECVIFESGVFVGIGEWLSVGNIVGIVAEVGYGV